MRHQTQRFVMAVTLLAGASGLVLLPADAVPAGTPKLGMVCDPGSVSGGTHSFTLNTASGYMQTPDGNSIYMWSYADPADPDPETASFQYPGPVLCVTQGQTVSINLHNGLPVATSLVFPGQNAVTASAGTPGLFTTEVAAGDDITYTFTASQPGTYVYESGTDTSKQIEMGLYGALVVRPSASASYAYGASTAFDPKREYLILLSDVDPDLHHAVELNPNGTYDFNQHRSRYFAMNGREFPDTLQDNGVSWLANQPYGSLVRIQPYSTTNPLPALVRMINVGVLNHPYHPHGNHMSQIAQDGRLLLSPGGASAATERFGETIGAGQTQDYLLSWQDQDLWNPTTKQFPVPPPNYRDVAFKDSLTWYSGSPYLGYQGTLPTGTTSLNVCGEWYFPWHSHALNEFANFDAAFGGMATLLRVDPPGGCFTFPGSSVISAGTLRSGSVTALAADDTTYYQVNSTTSGNPRISDWYGGFTKVPLGSTDLTVVYKGRNCGTGAGACASLGGGATPSTTLSLWNWTTNAWFAVAGPTAIPATDVTLTSTTVLNGTPYIGTGTKKGQVRVRVLTTRASTTSFVTQANLFRLSYTAP